MSSSDTDEELNVSQHDVEDDLNAYQIGKFVVRGREIARAVLMSDIYFVLNFVNLARAFYKQIASAVLMSLLPSASEAAHYS